LLFRCSKSGRFVAWATHFPQAKPAESLRFRYEIGREIPDSREVHVRRELGVTRRREEREEGEVMHDLEDLARVVVDCGYNIHIKLGPGLLESVYEALLAAKLTAAGLRVERQKAIPLTYEGLTLAEGFRADLIIEDSLIVEIKSVENLAPVHAKQLLTYLRLTKQPLGLLINFGCGTFRDGVKRVVNGHTNFAASRLRVHQNQPGGSRPA
jgi:iron complex transport system substrate-binding protein